MPPNRNLAQRLVQGTEVSKMVLRILKLLAAIRVNGR